MMTSNDILLILMPWTPSPEWILSLSEQGGGINVRSHKIDMYATTDLPTEITRDTWANVTVLFTWKTFPRPEMTPRLQYVQLLSAGCNQIVDLPLFEDTSIPFCTANGIHPPQITEWVFSCFLGFQHHLQEHWENQKVGKWVDPESDEDTEDAVGLRIGILGYGCIGRQTARVARAFGMEIYAYTLHERKTASDRRDDESYHEPGLGDPEGIYPSRWFHGPDQLSTFLASDLDLLVVTLPLTPATRGMIGAEQFRLMSKRKTYICNAGRGAIIVTEDLIRALENGQIRGAAVDVTDPEPLPLNHPLWRAKNITVTPHCSGNSKQYNERALKILRYNLGRMREDKPLVNRVDKKLGY